MGLTLDQVVPWGRSLAEYIRMFDLSDTDQRCKILDCGGGPASFNSEMTQLGYAVTSCDPGYAVTSCDPVYQFEIEAISQRVAATYPIIIQGVRANLEHYVWHEMRSPEQLGAVRMAAMTEFLADFPLGLQVQRYRPAALPNLPFADGSFDLALCSHLLFTYAEQLDLDFHLQAIAEMGRVAREVRIFPLLTLAGAPYPNLDAVIGYFRTKGDAIAIHPVPYEFQRGGNQMLVINRCDRDLGLKI